jgi:NAD+ synthase (glutamine-hydrolysing)
MHAAAAQCSGRPPRAPRYDCSSADLNPIGAISKNDLRRFLVWAARALGYSALTRVEAAPPTAELEPVREGVAAQVRRKPCLARAYQSPGHGESCAAGMQLDEVDMGMTYEELGIYGRLRKVERCGPVSMFRRLLVEWRGRCALVCCGACSAAAAFCVCWVLGLGLLLPAGTRPQR